MTDGGAVYIGGERVASTVETAVTPGRQLRGLRGWRGVPDGYALVMPFDSASRRVVDMVGVRAGLDVVWGIDGAVARVSRLRPWLGLAVGKADVLIELPAGTAADVCRGDDIQLP